ncbi:MAG TPA: hypothetical protein VJ882_03460 [Desulfuromonadales bacterium]|nr:hypothetical protein [Desulfuromonadales bacterium]
MKTNTRVKVRITAAVAAILGTAIPAFAASGTRQDNSGYAVWVFLGICSLILLVQLLPVVFMSFGLIKGASSYEKKTEETSDVPATCTEKETAS